MTNPYRVYLEQGAKDGWCMVHCPEVPGMGFKAPSREAAVALAPLRLAEELVWAERAGLQVAVPDEPSVDVVGTVQVEIPVGSGDSEAIFGPELSPLGRDYLEFVLAYLRASRAALLDLAQRLPASTLAWRPARGKRTLAEVIGHIADADAFYTVRLEAPEAVTKDLWAQYAQPKLEPVARLEAARSAALDRLGRLSQADLERTGRHDPNSETWTARKVLRRMAWHERYHTRQIGAYLTL